MYVCIYQVLLGHLMHLWGFCDQSTGNIKNEQIFNVFKGERFWPF